MEKRHPKQTFGDPSVTQPYEHSEGKKQHTMTLSARL